MWHNTLHTLFALLRDLPASRFWAIWLVVLILAIGHVTHELLLISG